MRIIIDLTNCLQKDVKEVIEWLKQCPKKPDLVAFSTRELELFSKMLLENGHFTIEK